MIRCLGLLFAWLASAAGALAALPACRPDWKVELVATAPDIRHPSVVCVAPDGRVFVAEDPMDIRAPANAMEGRIVCFHPGGRRTVFAEKLHAVFGMQYLEGKLYLLHNPKFSVFTDAGDLAGRRLDLIESTHPNPWALGWNDHVPANFRLAMDGFLYVSVGDKGVYGAVGRDGKRVDMRGGGLLRLRPDGTALEIFSTGTRNILDVAVNAEDEIFTYDNTDEQQWMGRLTHMVDGGFYGYPYDFIPRRPYTLWMMADYGGGAATGALAYNEDALPREYQGDLFLADFGKRQLLRVRVARQGGSYQTVSREDLFVDPPEDFRPVGIALAPDGLSLYLCDWNHRDTKEDVSVGRLWKLTYTGASHAAAKPAWFLPAALGRPFQAATSELIAGLAHPAQSVRLMAQRRLAERRATRPLLAVLRDRAAPSAARWHALWALDAVDAGKPAREAVLSAARDGDPSVRRQAIRQLGTRRVDQAAPLLIAQLEDVDASIRLQAATALGRIGNPGAVPALVRASQDADLFARYAAFTALNRIGRRHPGAWKTIARGLASDQSAVREGVTFALRETYDSALVDALARMAQDLSHPEPTREAALRSLASLHRQTPEWKGEWWAYHPVNAAPPAKSVAWAGTRRILEILRGGLDDTRPAVRLACVEAVREARDTQAAPKLRALFASESDPNARRLILSALGMLEDRDSAPLVAGVLAGADQSKDLLAEAIAAARRIGGATAGAALLQFVESGSADPALLAQALEGVGDLKVAGGVPALLRRATHADVEARAAAMTALAKIDPTNALAHLLPLLDHESADVRRSAVTAIGHLKARPAIPRLLTAFTDPPTRSDAVLALAQTPDVRALDVYLAGLTEESASLREASRRALAAIRSEALPLLETRVRGLLPVALRELRVVYAKDDAARRLFDAAPKAAEPEDYRGFALNHPGDAEAGAALFRDANGLGCIKCHVVGDQGGRIGPDLTTVGAQFSRGELAESILFPSKTVREGYQAVLVETRDGELFSGLFKGETAEDLSLMDSDGKIHRLRKSDLTQRRLSELSLMPEGLEAGLSLQQFADLVSFLESLKGSVHSQAGVAPAGFVALFNGHDLAGWKVDEATRAHWLARDGVLEHDGVDKDLWTEPAFGDFVLALEWRWPGPPKWEDFPLIDAEGNEVKTADGKTETARVLDAGDSGVFLRGYRKAQANLFCYPVGSGEVWEYRTDLKMPPSVRRAVTPRKNADRPIGEWNRMQITLKGDRLTVVLNGEEIISGAELPGIPGRGPIGLQHEHGPIQFRNIFLKELAE